MRTVEVIKHVLTLTSEEKNILHQAEEVLAKIAVEDNDERLWWHVNTEFNGCNDFYDLSAFLAFLANDENELLV